MHGSERTVTKAENNKECKEIKESRQRGGKRRTAVLDTLEEELQKDYVQNDIQNQGDGGNDDRSLGVPRGIERRDNQLD